MRTFDSESQSRENYINQLFAKENPLKQSLRDQLKKDNKEGINVGPYEGKFLQFLVRLIQAKKIVEIGTLYGYSSHWMAEALPIDGKIFCFESEEIHFKKAKEFSELSPYSNKFEMYLGDANENLKKIESEGPFDLVFIDANKAGYLNYLDWAERNVRTGGLIIGDNTFLFGHVLVPAPNGRGRVSEKQIKVMQEFNLRLSNSQKYNSIMIPTAEGMTIGQKLD